MMLKEMLTNGTREDDPKGDQRRIHPVTDGTPIQSTGYQTVYPFGGVRTNQEKLSGRPHTGRLRRRPPGQGVSRKGTSNINRVR